MVDRYIRKQDGVRLSSIQMVGLSGIQMAFGYQTSWHPISFRPFEFQTSVFRSPLFYTLRVEFLKICTLNIEIIINENMK